MKEIFFKTISLFLLLIVVGQVSLNAQNPQLAQQYYNTGEYEKAAELYEELYSKNKIPTYFSFYINCLTSLQRYDEAEKAVVKEIKKNPSSELYTTYGDLYDLQSKPELAAEQYQKAIGQMKANHNEITRLSGSFLRNAKYELAIKTYERGAELLKDKNIFAYNLGDLYRRKGNMTKMIDSYLLAVESSPANMRNVQNTLIREVTDDILDTLQIQLIEKIQENPDRVEFLELLLWTYTQKKDYSKAMRQAKALDLRLSEDGRRIFDLANVASNDSEFDVAIEGFQYILDKKMNSVLALPAKEAIMKNKRRKITQNYDYTEADLRSLESEYESFLEDKGRNANTALIMANLAELEALYLNDLDKAIVVLEELIQIKGINTYIVNNAKLDLGDYYLMKGEVWDATLLYSQVDKDLKEAYLGEMARFKNAKLSYYNGDFEWAQSQFDILKASTSKLISNDAIDLSVFILDNLGLDSIATPLEMFAHAELMSFQNRYDDSFKILDSILLFFPEHGLTDDVLYTKANAQVRLKNFDTAILNYEKIIKEYPEEIRADNAIFALANLYEYQLNDREKAKELYEKLFLEYSNSTFAIDSRKKYRILRGDDIN